MNIEKHKNYTRESAYNKIKTNQKHYGKSLIKYARKNPWNQKLKQLKLKDPNSIEEDFFTNIGRVCFDIPQDELKEPPPDEDNIRISLMFNEAKILEKGIKTELLNFSRRINMVSNVENLRKMR